MLQLHYHLTGRLIYKILPWVGPTLKIEVRTFLCPHPLNVRSNLQEVQSSHTILPSFLSKIVNKVHRLVIKERVHQRTQILLNTSFN